MGAGLTALLAVLVNDRRPRLLVSALAAAVTLVAGAATWLSHLAGKTLEKLPCLKEYWFDWKTYHPRTSVYSAGVMP